MVYFYKNTETYLSNVKAIVSLKVFEGKTLSLFLSQQ